jgi:hypothetical protein
LSGYLEGIEHHGELQRNFARDEGVANVGCQAKRNLAIGQLGNPSEHNVRTASKERDILIAASTAGKLRAICSI